MLEEAKGGSLPTDFTRSAERKIQNRSKFRCQKCGKLDPDNRLFHIVGPESRVSPSRPSHTNYPDLVEKSFEGLCEFLSSESNGLMLCYWCEFEVEKNPKKFTREVLEKMMTQVPERRSIPPSEKEIREGILKRIFEDVITGVMTTDCNGDTAKPEVEKKMTTLLEEADMEASSAAAFCGIVLDTLVRYGCNYSPSDELLWNMTKKICWAESSVFEKLEEKEPKDTHKADVSEVLTTHEETTVLLNKLKFLVLKNITSTSFPLFKCLIVIMALVNSKDLPDLEEEILKEKNITPEVAAHIIAAGKHLRKHDDTTQVDEQGKYVHINVKGIDVGYTLRYELAVGRFPTFRNT